MPGEMIEIDVANYPNLANLEPGEDISLKIKGKVGETSEEGKLTITTESIEQVDVNPAKGALKVLMAGKNQKQPMMAAEDEDGEY